MLRRILDGIYWGAGVLAGLFLLSIFVLMMGLSLGREVGLNIPSGDDFTSWAMAAMAFLGLAHTFKSGDMIRVELLFERFKGRTRQVMEVLCLTLSAVVAGYFSWHATLMTYDSYRFFEFSQGVLAVPMWIPQIGYALGLIILTIAIIDELFIVLSGRKPTYEKPPATSAEEVVERAIQSGV